MSNNIGLPITGFFPSSTAASSSNMTAGETATRKEATSPSCSHAAAVIPSSSITSSTSSSFEAPPAPSLVSAHERGYKHSDIAAELSTISPESIILTHGKTFVKTADLAYFSRLKKQSKVWSHGTQLLEVQSKKKYWLYDYCMFFHADINYL